MYPYLGDFPAGKTIFFPFHTFASTGASVTLTGLATTDIEVYKGASMTQRSSDAGYALVDTDGIDLDGITGIHGFTIDTSDNTDAGFYAAGNDYTVVISAVTVDSQTVNFIAGSFSIDNRGLLRPTTASRTLDVTATGEAGLDFANVALPAGAIPSLGIVDSGTAQTAGATSIQLRSAAAFADDELIGATIVITGGSAGVGQSRVITDYVSGTDTATVDAWTTTPTGTITYIVIGSAPASATALPLVTLANGAHGGAAATLTLQKVVVSNSTNGESAVAITASGTGNAHGLSVLASGGGKGVAIGAASVGLSVSSSAADAVQIQGGTDSDGLQVTGNGTGVDIRGNITGNVSGSVGSVTAEVTADVQKVNGVALVGDGGTTPWGP